MYNETRNSKSQKCIKTNGLTPFRTKGRKTLSRKSRHAEIKGVNVMISALPDVEGEFKTVNIQMAVRFPANSRYV